MKRVPNHEKYIQSTDKNSIKTDCYHFQIAITHFWIEPKIHTTRYYDHHCSTSDAVGGVL